MDTAKSEVLRYLGRRGQNVPVDIDCLVTECMELVRKTASPRDISAEFMLTGGDGGLLLEGTLVMFKGNDIARHLLGCGEAVVMAATLGVEIDRIILREEYVNLTRSLILDAAATQFIEEICGVAESKIHGCAARNGLKATGRFSPGYGDFTLDIQPDMLSILDAGRKIGLTCTENLLLFPRKSVTAVIGLGENPSASVKECDNCNMRNKCLFRKDGVTCGYLNIPQG